MKKIDLSQAVTILANIGVIAGIVFLAMELQQNTQQLKLQSYQAWQSENNEINMRISDPELSAIVSSGHRDSTNLTSDNYIAYAMFHMSFMQMAQSTHYLYLQGSMDSELWQSEMDRAAAILTFPGVRQWWDSGGRTQLTPSFASFIESVQTDQTIRWNWDPELGFFPDELSAPSGAAE